MGAAAREDSIRVQDSGIQASFSVSRRRAESTGGSASVRPSSSGAAMEAVTRRVPAASWPSTSAHPAVMVRGRPSTSSPSARSGWPRWRDSSASMAICPRRSTEPENGRIESTSTPSSDWAAVMRVSGRLPWGRSTTMSSTTVPSVECCTTSTERMSPSVSPSAAASRPKEPGASGICTRMRYDMALRGPFVAVATWEFPCDADRFRQDGSPGYMGAPGRGNVTRATPVSRTSAVPASSMGRFTTVLRGG